MRWTTLISGYIFYCRPTGQFYVFLTNNQGSISYKWEGWIFHAENCKLPPPTSLFDDKCLWPIRKLSGFICRVCCEKCLNGQFQNELLFLPFPPTFQGRKELSKIKAKKISEILPCYYLLLGWRMQCRQEAISGQGSPLAINCIYLCVCIGCTFAFLYIFKCVHLQMCTFANVYICICVHFKMCSFANVWLTATLELGRKSDFSDLRYFWDV